MDEKKEKQNTCHDDQKSIEGNRKIPIVLFKFHTYPSSSYSLIGLIPSPLPPKGGSIHHLGRLAAVFAFLNRCKAG